MRILLVSDYATPTGGGELIVLALRDALRRRGHDVRLFASSARPLNLPSQADYECFGLSSRLRGLTQLANPSAYWRLQRVLLDFQPEVVHVRLFLSQLSPLILPLLRDIPALYHVAWYRSICPVGTKMLPNSAPCREPAGLACLKNHCLQAYAWPSLMLQMKLWRHWRGAFKLIVANSHATKRRLEAEGIRPVEVVWNGVPVRAQRKPFAAPVTVAFAGRLIREKGADVLVEAFAKVVACIPEAKLLIAGDGPERIQLVSQIDQLHLNSSVTLLGHLSRAELEARFSNAWVQVVPSRWEEPFGIVAAESLMRGTAVVASDAGGLAEIVLNNETGVLVPPGDPQALGDALLSLLENRERAEWMGGNARQFALQHLTEEAFVNRFLELYELLCKGRTFFATG
ncbi:MAG: glycosyltransferase family 1 protein [Acidobacteria bacterium]|nr:MAG: glycosyltransferase family 1 protein [Acidobacteriota bacterium]